MSNLWNSGIPVNYNRNYLNELKSQMHHKPNKIELNNMKMIERQEIDKLNSYNPFGRGGSGAPIRDESGNIVTVRKTIANNNIFTPQKNFSNEYALNNRLQIGKQPNFYDNVNNNFHQNIEKEYKLSSEGNNINYEHSRNNGYPNNISYYDQKNNNQYDNYLYYQKIHPYNIIHQYENINLPNNNLHHTCYDNTIPPKYYFNYNDYYNPSIKNITNNEVPYLPRNEMNHINFPTYDNSEKQFNQTYEINKTPTPNNLPSNSQENGAIKQDIDSDQFQNKKLYYQSILKQQIDEKKHREELLKKQEKELDMLEEKKYYEYLDKKKQQDKIKKNKFIEKIEPPKKEIIEDKNNIGQEPHIPDKPIDIYYNKGKIMYGEGFTNEDELKNFQNMIGINLENVHKTINDDLNDQISKLKYDVNKNNRELTEYINKLKLDVKEASQLKFEAERELDKIKDEIERKKVTNIIYEDKLSDILNKHAPYNNLHIPIQDVNPIYEIKNKKLKSKEEYLEVNNMSNLANTAKKFMTKSEFVPIEQVKNLDNNSIVNYSPVAHNSDSAYFVDLYSKLGQITEINNNINNKSKYNTIKKNFETDIHSKYIKNEDKIIDIESESNFPFDESLKLDK